MAEAFGKLPKEVSKVFLHTGNMFCFPTVITNVDLTDTEQVIECLQMFFNHVKEVPHVENGIVKFKTCHLVEEPQRPDELHTTVKLFLKPGKLSVIKDALDFTLEASKLRNVDTVIVSYSKEGKEKEQFVEDMRTVWGSLEDYVKNGRVSNIGISDVGVDDLVPLYNVLEIKPSSVQLNVDVCCVVPKDLQDFCKEHQIRILIHRDPEDIIPLEKLGCLFTNEKGEVLDVFPKMSVSWASRVISHIKERGILAIKSYMIGLEITQ